MPCHMMRGDDGQPEPCLASTSRALAGATPAANDVHSGEGRTWLE